MTELAYVKHQCSWCCSH